MIFYTYILQSEKNHTFYIGQTQNLENRFQYHNKGRSNYTKKFIPFRLIWYSVFETRKEAFALEQKLKAMKSKNLILKFIAENPCVHGSDNLQISDLLDYRESS